MVFQVWIGKYKHYCILTFIFNCVFIKYSDKIDVSGKIINFRELIAIKLKVLLKSTIKAIYESIRRFPVTIGICIALVVMLIVTHENTTFSKDTIETLQRINMIIALGIPLSLCFKLIFENRKTKITTKLLVYAIGVVSLLLYYFFLLKDFSMVSITRYIGVNIFLYLAFIYIPWIGKKEHYEYYVIKILGSFFITIIYSAVLYFGLSAILFTIDKLFNANIPGKLFYYMFLIVAGIFAPSYFLAKIPYNYHIFKDSDYPKALKVLLLYIVIPLVIVYTAILYVYFAKIIITKNWPIGLVSHLVLWYSVITVGVLFFIFPLLDKSKLAKTFTFWFPKIIIPIIIMMFLSIGIRIKSYGITENRYFVLVLGLWVLGIMIYFSLSKRHKNIIIPISLSIIALNSVLGPISSYSISKYSQNKRLERILTRNNMISEEKSIKANTDISSKDKIEISMILQYFKDNHNLDNVKYISEDFSVYDMEKVFGFPYTADRIIDRGNYFYYDNFDKAQAIDIIGYEYLVRMNSYLNKITIAESTLLTYDNDTLTLKVIDKNKVIYSKKLGDFISTIYKKHNTTLPNGEKSVDIKDMMFEDENENIKVKLIFNQISGNINPSTGNMDTKDTEFTVLINIK